jgi:hypothetical protein
MLTIFTMPRRFDGVFSLIQKNAITSWTKLRPICEIVLFGNEDGTAELARELEVRHIPSVVCNSLGTPLVNDLFEQAERVAANKFLAYVNTDIILMRDFMEAVRLVAHAYRRFLLVGQRRNINIAEPINFSGEWEACYRQLGLTTGTLYPGIDYFVYPATLWGKIPPFALGRYYWDNWFLYGARLRKAPVIDATQRVLALHQNHPIREELIGGSESKENLRLMGGGHNLFTTYDVTHQLTDSGVVSRCRSCYPMCTCKFPM